VIAYSRPFWPLFLHVLGAMTLFGGILTATIVSGVAWRRPGVAVLRRAAFWALVASIPDYVVMRAGAQWIYSKEGWTGHNDPTWLNIGFPVADGGALLLLIAIGTAWWWRRSGRPVAGHILTGVSSVYLLLLAVSWLAMSGKWD
jgi:hypothetical protein